MSYDPNDPMFFTRLRRHAKFWFVGIALFFVFMFIGFYIADAVAGTLGAKKEKINRDDVYYEIVNDNDDHGNYIETYHLPNGRGGQVYCIVYSDKIGKSGGGAGIDCDWTHSS